MSEAKKILEEQRKQRQAMLNNHEGGNLSTRIATYINMGYMILAIFATFMISNIMRGIVGFTDLWNINLIVKCVENNVEYVRHPGFDLADEFARFFFIINRSVNFIFYCAFNSAFRVSEFHKIL